MLGRALEAAAEIAFRMHDYSTTLAHARRGGAACDVNGDCISQFCDKDLKVCIDPCVSDGSCAVGLSCEPIYMRPGAATGITWGRACVNASFGTLVESL